jgi:hypothetical protein
MSSSWEAYRQLLARGAMVAYLLFTPRHFLMLSSSWWEMDPWTFMVNHLTRPLQDVGKRLMS